MRTELVSIPTDTVPLDGAWYEPDGGSTAGAVIFFHGNTMNFYVGAPRFLPPALTELGFACLAFNRRGHDILSVRDNKEHIEGAAFQTSAQAQQDHDIAGTWLAERGFCDPVVVAHSNGGMMAPPFVTGRPDTRALVLLSAGRGGPAREQRSGLLAGGSLPDLHAAAQGMVDAGRGGDLMMVPGWWYVLTAESFLDRLETVPNILDYAPKLTCPVLYVRGDAEPEQTFPGEEYARLAGGACEVAVLADCDHFYVGKEAELTALICDFLSRHVRPDR